MTPHPNTVAAWLRVYSPTWSSDTPLATLLRGDMQTGVWVYIDKMLRFYALRCYWSKTSYRDFFLFFDCDCDDARMHFALRR